MSAPEADDVLKTVLKAIGGRDAFRDRTEEEQLFINDAVHRALARERIAGREPDERLWEAVRAHKQYVAGQCSLASLQDHLNATDRVREALWEARGDNDPAVVTAHCVYWALEAIVAPSPAPWEPHVASIMGMLAEGAGLAAYARFTNNGMSTPPGHEPLKADRCPRCVAGPMDETYQTCHKIALGINGGERSAYIWMAQRLQYRLREPLLRDDHARAIELL